MKEIDKELLLNKLHIMKQFVKEEKLEEYNKLVEDFKKAKVSGTESTGDKE